LLITLCGFTTKASAGASSDSTVVQKFQISYPINDTELHEDYLGNQTALRIIKEYFQKTPRIDSIIIYSYASPEGPYKLNRYLARERGKRARQYLLEHLPAERNFPDSLIIIKPTAENWEGLFDMVEESYPYDDKQDVLHLLSREDISNDRKKELLKRLNGGRPWRYIRDNILPELRYATWIAEWVYVPYIAESVPAVRPVATDIKAVSQQAEVIKASKAPQWDGPADEEGLKTILALKTNLLYDALSFANFSVEVPLYKDKLSLLYYHQFPWWTWGMADNEFCMRFLSIGGEARWWFGTTDRFNGHFIGAYAESGKYDFEIQRQICYQGEFYSAGLSYGYAMPIGKRLNLEFSLSAGYASIPYRGYTPSEDYEILWRDPDKVGRLQYFGPTKAQISLVIPIRVKTRGGNGL
jgi:hypothetical protein